MKSPLVLLLLLGVILSCKNTTTPPKAPDTPTLDTIIKVPQPHNYNSNNNHTSKNTVIAPHNTIVYQKAQDTTFYQGEKGGCYYLNKNGNKVYIDKTRCGTLILSKPKITIVKKEAPKPPPKKKTPPKPIKKKPTETRTYIIGKRGGCYYINSNGNKTYVDKSFCQ